MNELTSLLSVVLSIILVPIIINSLSYFKRKDVVARRVARARLPSGVKILEFVTFLILTAILGILSFKIAVSSYSRIHPNMSYLSSQGVSLSWNSLFDLFKIFGPAVVAVLLGIILSNLFFWLIPSVRKIEYEVDKGVPGASFKDATLGLLRISSILIPISIILVFVSILRA